MSNYAQIKVLVNGWAWPSTPLPCNTCLSTCFFYQHSSNNLLPSPGRSVQRV